LGEWPYSVPGGFYRCMAPRKDSTEEGGCDATEEARSCQSFTVAQDGVCKTDGSELGIINPNFDSTYQPHEIGFSNIGTPEEIELKLGEVGYHCLPFYAVQLSLLLNTSMNSLKCILLEGPSGCGKSFLAKSLAKITGAELMCVSCYRGMNIQHLVESPSTLAMVNAMAGRAHGSVEELMSLGIISRAFLASHQRPVILLVDEIDKVDVAIDTFFLGPIQDGRVWLESQPPIDANRDNLIVIFTKNFDRPVSEALMRRVHPLRMKYMDANLERRVLAPYCSPRLADNLTRVATLMQSSDGTYPFERPPAPEELLKAALYLKHLLSWDLIDFSFVGRNLFFMLAKSEHDRTVFELLLRYHPDFADPLVPDNRNATIEQIHARLGRWLLEGLVDDPDVKRRGKAYKPEKVGLTSFNDPEEMARRLADVGYQCPRFTATQMSLLLTTPSDRVRAVLLEGPSGCGKSYLAKSLAKITGAELMCLSCYHGMNTQHLIEVPSAIAIANSMAGRETVATEKLMNLGILSRAFLKSQNQPVILLVDEIDKVESSIDTFFLGPVQDGRIWLESRPPIDCNVENLLVIFTKNYNRKLDDALLRRLHPVKMSFIDSTLERRVLAKDCMPQLVNNLVWIAERMRNSEGSYQFERPPAPEELLAIGRYVSRMLDWNCSDFGWVGKNVWAMMAKSEHDRAVLEHMLRFHPDFLDPLYMDGKNIPIDVIYARLGRIILQDIVADPDRDRRERAWIEMEYA
jgi:MoxR-like ATPase